MERKTFEWRDDDGWHGTADALKTGRVAMALHDNHGANVYHMVNQERMAGIVFGLMRLASPALPSAGEFWIVETDGKRRVVQVQDTPTADTLRDDVQFIARIPVEAE